MNSKPCIYIQKMHCISTEGEDMKHRQNLLGKKIISWRFNCKLSGINIEMGQLKIKSSFSWADKVT